VTNDAAHAMDLSGKMNMDQMLEAAKLGAIIEFDLETPLARCARGCNPQNQARTPHFGILDQDGITD
jgi:hypothetical protein